MAEQILFKHIDEPGLHKMEVYERLGGYRALRRALTEMSSEAVLQALEASGLRGRGGAGFSMGKKASFLPRGAIEKYLCCNADESEPGTFKDRELMHKNPHQLVEGIVIGAYAAGVTRAFIYIRGEYEEEADILDAAVSEAYSRGYLGERILRSDFSCSLVVHRGAGAYICGEETALLDSLEGKRGNPRLKPPFPANQGLYQGPTLINNVETLSNLPARDPARRRLVPPVRHGEVARHQGGLGLRQRAPARQLRGRARGPVAAPHIRPRRRSLSRLPREGVVPRRLIGPGPHR